MKISKYKNIDTLLTEVNSQLLKEEASFYQYKALVRVRYNTDPELHMGSEKVCEILRGLPGGTRVNSIQKNKAKGEVICKVRIISQKDAKSCFIAFKRNCLEKFKGIILSVEIGAGSIEQTNFVK